MIDVIKAAKESGLDIYGLGTDAVKFIHALEKFEKIVRDDERSAIFNNPAVARQLIDAATLSSYPGGFLKREKNKCWCITCRPITISDMRFVVCPDCGNKRCPKANDHRNACTGSNEVGQKGSSWEHVKPDVES